MARILASSSPADSNPNMTPDSTKRNKYWWRVIGRVVSALLNRSSYSEDARARYDGFFKNSVAPFLGPTPAEYTDNAPPSSFMTDDHTPVEIGWVFKPTGEVSVQYAFDALSPIDGAPISPEHNLLLLHHLSIAGQCQRFDMTWTKKCSKSLLYPSKLLPRDLKRVSQFFIGVDLARNGIGLKAYFIPEARSRVTGISATDLLAPAVDSLGLGAQWSKATSYFSTLPAEYKITPVIVAVDCAPDSENRLKVYVRTEATHLSALCDMMTLGGQLKGLAIDATLAKLREIWRALFGSISDDTPVRHRDSNTGPTGFLFYYEMALGNPSLTPKIYIPAARFVNNDAHVAQVMSQFVGSSYCDDVRSLFPHRELESRSGIHSQLTLAAKKGSCQISSYMNPEAFSQHI